MVSRNRLSALVTVFGFVFLTISSYFYSIDNIHLSGAFVIGCVIFLITALCLLDFDVYKKGDEKID